MNALVEKGIGTTTEPDIQRKFVNPIKSIEKETEKESGRKKNQYREKIEKESGRKKNNMTKCIERNYESEDVRRFVNITKLIESKYVWLNVNITKRIESPLRSEKRNGERTIEKWPATL